MALGEAGESVRRAIRVEIAAGVLVIRAVVPKLVPGGAERTAPGVADGTGSLPGFLQVGDARAVAGCRFRCGGKAEHGR